MARPKRIEAMGPDWVVWAAQVAVAADVAYRNGTLLPVLATFYIDTGNLALAIAAKSRGVH